MTELQARLEATGAAADGTRGAHTLLTDPDATAVWSIVRTQLSRYLMSRGATPVDVDDLVQEVALRSIDREISYTTADDLVAWCLVVARNLHTDSARRTRPTESLGDIDREASSMDVATTVEQRLALREVVKELRTLSASDLDILLATRAAVGSQTRMEANRLAVRRHRIRGRLTKLAGGLLGGVGLIGLRFRRPAVSVGLAGATIVAVAVTLVPAPATGQAPAPRFGPTEMLTTPLTADEQRGSPGPALRVRTRPAQPPPKSQVAIATLHPHTMVVDPDGHHPVYVDKRPAGPDEHLLCVDHLPALSATCVG